jgi:hypothetical protein
MNTARMSGLDLERLVDRHIELCQLFEGRRTPGRREIPLLVAITAGKPVADYFVDLVDRALAAYEGSGFVQDSLIFSLKSALVQEIVDKLD